MVVLRRSSTSLYQPGTRRSAAATFLSRPVSVLEARLVLHDSLAADNDTWSTLQAQSARHVLVVTAGDVFLTTALGTA